jgi:hypothetical protein
MFITQTVMNKGRGYVNFLSKHDSAMIYTKSVLLTCIFQTTQQHTLLFRKANFWIYNSRELFAVLIKCMVEGHG